MDSEKKSKPWRCKKGCKPSSTPCSHLEGKLPTPMHSKIGVKDYARYEGVSREDPEFEAKCRRLEAALLNIGIEKFRIDVLMDRHVSRLSWQEISASRGFLSPRVVQKLDSDTIQLLRAIGSHFLKKLLGDLD